MSGRVDKENSVTVSGVSDIEDDRFSYGQVPLAHVEDSIRLFDLAPGVGDDPMVCFMRTISLSGWDHGASYEALSYCWGSEEKNHTVICNGKRAKVTTSLFNALRSLRLVGKIRTLWADAICINQDDLDEKADQVSIMAKIYRMALRTVIYLGEQTESSQLAFDTIQRLCTASQVMPDPDKFVDITKLFRNYLGMVGPVAELSGTTYSLSRLALFPQPRCTAVVLLLQRPWFERVWVVQELLCARERLIVCGSDIIFWEMFLVALDYGAAIRIFSGSNSFGPRQSFKWLLGAVSVEDVQNMSLLQNLEFFHSWKASNPRDKIYAMHGIAHLENGHVSELGSQFSKMNLSPNYSLEPSELYQKIAFDICHHERNLDILSYTHFSSSYIKGLPSWAPDWSQGHSRLMPFRSILSSGNSFRASLDTASTPNLRGDILTLHGYVFDILDAVGMPDRDFFYSADIVELDRDDFRIHQVWKAWTTATSVDDFVQRIGKETNFASSFWWLVLRSAVMPITLRLNLQENLDRARRVIDWESIAFHDSICWASDREADLAIYLRTLTFHVDPLPAHARRVAFAGYREEMKWSFVYRPFARLGITNAIFILPFFPIFIAAALIIRYVNGKRKWNGTNYFFDSPSTTERRLARTAKRRLSLVPEAAKSGDSIALLKGGKVPLILRREGEQMWRIVGEAYVDGVMKGEMFDEQLCRELTFV